MGNIVNINIMDTIKILVDWLWFLKCHVCVSKKCNSHFYHMPKPPYLKVNINTIPLVNDCGYILKTLRNIMYMKPCLNMIIFSLNEKIVRYKLPILRNNN